MEVTTSAMLTSSTLVTLDTNTSNQKYIDYGDTNASSFEDMYDYEYSDHEMIMNVYLIPIIIIIGLAGNLLSFLVFICTHIKRLSSSMYLAALALADSGFLLSLLIGWFSWTEIELFHREGWCQFVIYTTFVCSFLSVWYVVCFTVERYVAVCHPFRRQDMCTTTRAKIVVFSLAFFAFVMYSYGIWTTGITVHGGTSMCSTFSKYIHTLTVLNYIDTVTTLIVPFTTITVLNIRIFCVIINVYKKRQPFDFKSSALTDVGDGVANMSRMTNRPRVKSQLRVTKMLLVVSTVFLLVNFPSHAVRMYAFITGITGTDNDPETVSNLQKWQDPSQFIYYMQFSINFFLYSLCGKNFRQALRRMCSKLRYRVSRVIWGSQTPMSHILNAPKIDDADENNGQGNFRQSSRQHLRELAKSPMYGRVQEETTPS